MELIIIKNLYCQIKSIVILLKKKKKVLKKLINLLKESSLDDEAEEIQTKIYDIGMSLQYENLKDWFSAFYQVILGQNQGPRLGSFIKFYGIKRQ